MPMHHHTGALPSSATMHASRRGGDNFFVRQGTTPPYPRRFDSPPRMEKGRNRPAPLTSHHSPVATKQIKQIITHSIGHASMVVHGRRPRLVTLIENEAPQGPGMHVINSDVQSNLATLIVPPRGPRRRLVIIIALGLKYVYPCAAVRCAHSRGDRASEIGDNDG